MDWQHEYNLNLVDWVQYTALIIIIKNLKWTPANESEKKGKF